MDESHDGPAVTPGLRAEGRALRGGPVSGKHEPTDRGELTQSRVGASATGREREEGRVFLVGAGPGDPDLLTRRAWEVIDRADAVLYDSLTAEALLAELPEGISTVDVGKRPPDPVSQPEIHDRLVSRAGAGESVVRLKGGDPNVFGRGGEEAEHLAANDVAFEVIPGVSSAVAAPSVAGIPLTHREHASCVSVVTGHESPDKEGSALDWGSLAGTVLAGGTLVVLMGVASLATYVSQLRGEGVPAETPLAIVEKATWEGERTVTTTLATAVEDARGAGVEPPAVTVVGDVVAVRDRVAGSLCRE